MERAEKVPLMFPRKFTYPFCYEPDPLVKEAAASMIHRISSTESLHRLFAGGKMLGVLMTDKGFLYSFSGLAGGKSLVEGFVPPIFDLADPSGLYKRREAEISSMPAGPGKSRASAELQDWIFSQYKVLNANGESLSIKEIFARKGLVPPGGTGDCAAPKLLQSAYFDNQRPLAMGEFWYGASPVSEVREQGRFYPSCTGKCGPLLTFMMEGLEVEENPLDKEFTESEPEILFSDNDIIVADKPAGMLSVPGRTKTRSLLDWLQERYGEVYSCHRLDMGTSGVTVYARTPGARSETERQFSAREVTKTYRARLSSGPAPFAHAPRGTIALPLSLDYYDRPRQMVDFNSGKLAVTEYEVIGILPDGEVDIRFTPKTGRTHQLRVHSAHALGLGRPIKGDRLYGSPESGRLYLHAESITFRHPSTHEEMTFRTGIIKEISCDLTATTHTNHIITTIIFICKHFLKFF